MPTNLSDLLKAIHLEDADCALLALAPSVQLRLPQSPRTYCHIVLSGTVHLDCDGEPLTTLNAGEAAILNHGNQHRLFVDADDALHDVDYFRDARHEDIVPRLHFGAGRAIVTMLSMALFFHQGRRALASHLMPDVVPLLAANAATWAMPLPDLRQLETLCTGSGSVALAATLGHLLNVQAVRLYANQITSSGNIPSGMLRVPQIATAWRLIHSDPGAAWSIAKLAQAVGLSRSAFTEKFLAAVGEPTMQFVTRVRMERAANLLVTESMSISAIAHQVGYNSLSSFSREFKRRFGAAPRDYREDRDDRQREL